LVRFFGSAANKQNGGCLIILRFLVGRVKISKIVGDRPFLMTRLFLKMGGEKAEEEGGGGGRRRKEEKG
jgi:hypothetical protein